MPKSNQSSTIFHKVNNNLTVNLAEVAAVEDLTEYFKRHADNQFIAPLLASGQTCRITLLRYEDRMMGWSGGHKFDITREEMTALQDALNWYSRMFGKTEQ